MQGRREGGRQLDDSAPPTWVFVEKKRNLSRARHRNIAINPTSLPIREMSFFAVRQNEARKEQESYAQKEDQARTRRGIC